MVQVAVGQHDCQRFVCKRLYKCRQILKTVSRIDQQGFLLSNDQRSLHTSRLIDMIYVIGNLFCLKV